MSLGIDLRAGFAGLAFATSLSIAQGTRAAANQAVPIGLQPCNAHGMPLKGPGYYVLRLPAGSSTKLYARIWNRGGKQTRISVIAVDATHDIYGNISYNLPQAPRKTVGRWVHLRHSSVRLAGRHSVIVQFTLRIPAFARAGRYLGALTVFVPVETAPQRGRAVMKVQIRLADAIVVTVRSQTRNARHVATG